MICPYCNMKIKDKSSYCIMCGKIFYLETIDNNAPKMEKELFSIYFKDGKIPWQIHRISCGYLFFGFIYAFYKKMYVEGFISMIATTTLLYLLMSGGSMIIASMGFYFYSVISLIVITIGIHLYYLFNITYLRLAYIKTKIARTIIDYKDDEEKQKEICRKDSKNSLKSVILSIFAFFITYIIISFIFSLIS